MYSSPVNEHDFLLRCVPQERPEQRIVEMHLDVQPLVTGGNFGVDSFGNRTYTGRLPRGHTTFSGVFQNRLNLVDTLPREQFSQLLFK